jgi:hypothetical protein
MENAILTDQILSTEEKGDEELAELNAMVHACKPSTQAEAGGLQVPGQPGLQSEILSQKTKG